MAEGSELPASVVFGRFQVYPHRRELLADNRPLKLGGRAFDLLLALLEARGAVVGKDAVMTRVWPDRVVEENNLQSHISALRAALGPDRDLIRTVSGRGYQFTGEIRLPVQSNDTVQSAPAAAKPADRFPTNLREPISELIGRDDQLPEVLGLVGAHRLVTLTGAGGIGKTQLALAAARALRPRFGDGVWLVEMSPVADPRLIPAAVADALGLERLGEASERNVSRALTGRALLLVLDTCEHVIEAAANMAEAVLGAGPDLRIIATSREPLRAEGEWVYPVPALGVPGEGTDQHEALGYGAIRLFLDRAGAASANFMEGQNRMAAIATICRCLDGIPLAIELAAARVAALGVEGLAAHLNDRFQVLIGGRRTAMPRHRTLRATFDWSYNLLADPERIVLRRLAIFAGSIGLDTIGSVIMGHDIPGSTDVECIANLVAKSLVNAVVDEENARYRLLDTVRAYALEKLNESGEYEMIARRRAAFYLDLFERAEVERKMLATTEWLAEFDWRIDDLRATLNWAFSDGGDIALGAGLTAASADLWFGLSLWTECRVWTGEALARLDPSDHGSRREMVLRTAFGTASMFTQGLNKAAHQALTRADEIAESLQDAHYRVRALAALAACCHRLEQFEQALDIGRRAETIASRSDDPITVSMAHWILGTSLLFLGEFLEAHRHAELTCRLTGAPTVRRAHIVLLGRDGSIAARCTMAIALWPQGLVQQSADVAHETLDATAETDHPFSFCTALTWCGCIVPLLLGDFETADRASGRLDAHARKHDLVAFHAYAMGFRGQLCAARSEYVAAERHLRECLDTLRRIGNDNHPAFRTSLAEVLAKSGQTGAGLLAADEAVKRIERTRQLWFLPEALRTRGETFLLTGNTLAAQDDFGQAQDVARRQGALSWQLRAASSLASLLRDQGWSAAAMELLQPVYDRFTEGFSTADLKSAEKLLLTLSDHQNTVR